jgi:hypothetical protein
MIAQPRPSPEKSAAPVAPERTPETITSVADRVGRPSSSRLQCRPIAAATYSAEKRPASATRSQSVGSPSATRIAICGRLATNAAARSRGQLRLTATAVEAAKTMPAKAVPIGDRSLSKSTIMGTSVAPISPIPATSSEPQTSEVTRPTVAIPAAIASAPRSETRS